MNPDSQHPGELVRSICLDAFGLTVTEGARNLGVTRQALNNLVNGRAGISAEMAIRLERVFGGGAATWLQHQLVFDLTQARAKAQTLRVEPLSKKPLFSSTIRDLLDALPREQSGDQ